MEVGKKEELLVGKRMLYKVGVRTWLESLQLRTKDSYIYFIFFDV